MQLKVGQTELLISIKFQQHLNIMIKENGLSHFKKRIANEILFITVNTVYSI